MNKLVVLCHSCSQKCIIKSLKKLILKIIGIKDDLHIKSIMPRITSFEETMNKVKSSLKIISPPLINILFSLDIFCNSKVYLC